MSESTEPTEATTETTEATAPKTFDEAYVGQLRKESAGYRTRAKELETALEAAKAEADSARTGAPALEARAASAEHMVDRLTVAIEKGLPLTLVGRLTGNTRDELSADADALVKLLTPAESKPLDYGAGSTEQPIEKPDVNAALRALAGRTAR